MGFGGFGVRISNLNTGDWDFSSIGGNGNVFMGTPFDFSYTERDGISISKGMTPCNKFD